MRRRLLLCAAVATLSVRAGAAPDEAAEPLAAPALMHYQARFTDGSGPLPGPAKLTFRFHRQETAGPILWVETHTDVPLVDGLASVLLGSLVSLPPDLLFSADLFLGVTVNDGAELVPRMRVASVPYALEAGRLEGKRASDFEPAGAVLVLSLSDGSPPNAGQNRVHWDVLRGVPEGFADGDDAGVDDHGGLTGLEDDDHPQYPTHGDLETTGGRGPNDGKNLVHWENLVGVPTGFADGADNTSEGGSLDHGELLGLQDDDHPQYALDADLAAHEGAPDPHPGYTDTAELAVHAGDASAHHPKTVSASELTEGTLDPARLPQGGVTGAHVADGSLTGDDLQNQSVGEADLAANVITSAKVVDGSLTGADLAPSSVGGDRLVAGSVTSLQLAPAAFDSTNLSAGGVSRGNLAPGAVDSTRLARASVDSLRLAAASVDSVHLRAGSVRGTHLAPGAVGPASIAGGSVGSAQVTDESLTGTDIKNGTLTALDLLDEPGVDFASDPDLQALGAVPTTILQQSLFAPASGWVLATAVATGCVEGPIAGVEAVLAFSVSASSGTLDPASRVAYRVNAPAASRQCVPLFSQVLVPAPANSIVTVYVVAQGEAGVVMDLSGVSLALAYFPTRY